MSKARAVKTILLAMAVFLFAVFNAHSGVVLFEDNFNDGNFDGWTVTSGTWAVENGQLSGTGLGHPNDAFIFAGDESWTDYILEAKVVFVTGNAEILIRKTGTGGWFSNSNFYRFELWSKDSPVYPNCFQFARAEITTYTTYVYVPFTESYQPDKTSNVPSPVSITNPCNVKVEVRGNIIRLFINNQLIYEVNDPDPLLNGKIALGVIWDWHCHFDDVKVTSIEPETNWKTLYEQCQAQLNPTTTTTISPTLIEMSSLSATPANKKVKLEWKTESEIDNAGFNVWRAEGFQKVNPSLIPAEGSPTAGADYDFVDDLVFNGKQYIYLIEDMDNGGISTFHGPVKAVPRMIYGQGK